MNKILTLALVALTLVVSCKKSGDEARQADSEVALSTLADGSLNVVTKASPYDIPLPTGYVLTITDENEDVVLEDKDFSGAKSVNVPRGAYTATVTSGPGMQATFEAPSYKGTSEFEAVTGQKTEVKMTAKLSCVVVDVNFSDQLKSSFLNVTAQVWSEDVNRLVFAKTDNDKLGYFTKTNLLKYSVTVTTWQNVSYVLSGEVDKLKFGDLVCLNFDIDGKQADETEPVAFDIKLDQVINEITTTHILNTTMESYAAPLITGRQVDLAKPVGVKYKNSTDLNIDIVTRGKLEKVLLIAGDNYTKVAGMTAPIMNLMENTAQSALGISFKSGGIEGVEESLINLTGLTPRLPGSETDAREFRLNLGVLDQNGQYSVRELVFNVYGVSVTTLPAEGYDAVDWFGARGPRNRVNVTLKGRYNLEIAPDEMQFFYRVKDGGTDWTKVEAVIGENKQVTAKIDFYGVMQTYEYKLVDMVSDTHADIMNFTVSGVYPEVENMSFDQWSGSPSNPSGGWSSPNSSLGGSYTVPITGWNGTGRAVQMTATEPMSIFASGGLFTGYLDMGSGLIPDTKKAYEFSKVGINFAGRPKKLVGYYKYVPQPIKHSENTGIPGNSGSDMAVNGQPDQFEIAIKLEKWNGADYKTRWRDGFYGDPGSSYNGQHPRFATELRRNMAVGYGQMTAASEVAAGRMNSLEAGQPEWTRFEIDITYSQDILPDKIIVTAVSSRWGGYLSGGPDSKLWVDNFELVW